jgi:cis-3-alkyl-4-acyloxetan-2-one decarboxylase
LYDDGSHMVSKDLYPFQSHYFEHSGKIRQHYVDEGTGDPVVMVHGNPTWSFYFRSLVEALRGSHRTIVPDHIGCGYSDKPTDAQYAYTLEQRVADLTTLLDHLGIKERITLVLHDWGGMIGMGYASQFPERISRIILSNTSAFHLPATKSFPIALKICRDTPVGSILVRGMNAFSASAARVCAKRRPLQGAVKSAYLSPYHNWDTRRAVLRFVEDIPLAPTDQSYDLVTKVERSLAKFQDKPMLICWGAKDFVFDDHFLNGWKERFPKATVHRFADVGHYVLEDAWEEVVPLVKAFMEAHEPISPHMSHAAPRIMAEDNA